MKGSQIALALAALFLASPAMAKDCRLPQPALGAAAQQASDCATRKDVKPQVDNRLKRGERGFIDLGNGTQVRVSGRVRVDTEYRR
ncbi:hypothetical protein AB4072_00220 [Microvirga sp. 2MCAF38]|uniref:hypothetical protein n=1 Tax=Microvirga sp. 2MCAF38 TaxID=3232989 RepID=UPI003F991B88